MCWFVDMKTQVQGSEKDACYREPSDYEPSHSAPVECQHSPRGPADTDANDKTGASVFPWRLNVQTHDIRPHLTVTLPTIHSSWATKPNHGLWTLRPHSQGS